MFTGTHGVGKTVLLQELVTRGIFEKADPRFCHWNYMIFDGIGRRVHTKRWSEKSKQRYFNYWYVWNHYIYRNFVGSRSIYDTWAYSRLGIGLDFNRHLFNWAVRHITYDFVFYIPIEFPLVEDGIRYTDTEFQILHDKETKLILEYHHIPYHKISGSVSQRIDQVRTILNV